MAVIIHNLPVQPNIFGLQGNHQGNNGVRLGGQPVAPVHTFTQSPTPSATPGATLSATLSAAPSVAVALGGQPVIVITAPATDVRHGLSVTQSPSFSVGPSPSLTTSG